MKELVWSVCSAWEGYFGVHCDPRGKSVIGYHSMSQANQGIEPPWNFAPFMLPATSPYRHREGCSRNKVRCLQIGSCLQSRGIKKSAQIVENNAAVIERIYPFCPPVCVNRLILFSSVYHTLFFILFFSSSYFILCLRLPRPCHAWCWQWRMTRSLGPSRNDRFPLMTSSPTAVLLP